MVTHNDRRGAKHNGLRADEVVDLMRAAKVLDVREHPRLHPELHSARNDSSDDLAEEHRAVWDLHVVTDFQVTYE
jgi:hypothetical protein